MAKLIFFLSALLFLASPAEISAVEFEVINKASNSNGGVRFNDEVGVDYSKKVLANATDFIWELFQENTDAERKYVRKVSLFIDDVMNIAITIGNEIHVSSPYINAYPGDVKSEVTGIIFHEMTHIWQWFGNQSTPVGLLEGIADYVRLKAGYAPRQWESIGIGQQWDEGFAVTARFLDYCNGLRNGFVAELNKKMRNGYSDDYFVDLLAKTVDQLWTEYKAKHGNLYI